MATVRVPAQGLGRFRARRERADQCGDGSGKDLLPAYLGPLAELIDERERGPVTGLRILFVTPLRAMSRDIELALKAPVSDLGIGITVESRTGDTSTAIRARQRLELPQVLITTPESLSLLLTRENCEELFGGLRSIIVDEWHELLSSKRGTQMELAMARLRRIARSARTWALSATLANIEEAARAAVGVGPGSPAGANGQRRGEATIIRAEVSRPVEIRTLIPARPDAIPWAGHLGLKLLDDVLGALDPERSTLIFANTRHRRSCGTAPFSSSGRNGRRSWAASWIDRPGRTGTSRARSQGWRCQACGLHLIAGPWC
jgi:ATP-dependent Lhr-like helicase